ncbi:hypothetical protein J437_LFUL007937 [Ladona fulva]|uniref:Uncharacterized protein n=1 Tax=Ladona fulva TaxID=123851 RepID=A0A8K0KB82_LADFU|nr:hypothetical protein J437_LFUL007937 [Ladona fulva]
MKKAVMATYYHSSSTDNEQQHHYCPLGANSWCAFHVAEAEKNLMDSHHPPPLHPDVKEAILPIYEDLSHNSLANCRTTDMAPMLDKAKRTGACGNTGSTPDWMIAERLGPRPTCVRPQTSKM